MPKKKLFNFLITIFWWLWYYDTISPKAKYRIMKEVGIKTEFLARTMKGKGVKMLPPKQILQKLPLLLAQVRAGNLYEKLVNEIWQIVYLLNKTKQIWNKYTIIYSNQFRDDYNIC